ncbi:MAG: NUDIX hydrolase [Thermoleophilia bacterium]
MTHSQTRVSAGGIVVRGSGAIEVCLIRPSGRGRRVWGLPKGGIEDGETLEQAALREVAEETGLVAEIHSRLGTIDYSFYSREQSGRIHKTVHYFLMHAIGGDTAHHDHEVSEARWARIDDALAMMTYPNEREMVRRALTVLSTSVST